MLIELQQKHKLGKKACVKPSTYYICCNVSSNTFYKNMGFVDGKERRILPGKPCGIVVSPKLPRESLSLGRIHTSLGSEAELAAEMMCLVVLRVEHANHSTAVQPDGFYTTSLLSALETAACLPAHLLAGSKVPLWLALKGGKRRGKGQKVCVEGKKGKKKQAPH